MKNSSYLVILLEFCPRHCAQVIPCKSRKQQVGLENAAFARLVCESRAQDVELFVSSGPRLRGVTV